jgi:hypothetical protein
MIYENALISLIKINKDYEIVFDKDTNEIGIKFNIPKGSLINNELAELVTEVNTNVNFIKLNSGNSGIFLSPCCFSEKDIEKVDKDKIIEAVKHISKILKEFRQEVKNFPYPYSIKKQETF